VKIDKPRGTRDFLPEDMEKRREIERIMRDIAEKYGYREILTPTFEHVELFTLKSGEEITKEMYTFRDKSGRMMALRPELTAPVTRMFVNSCSVMPKPLRFYYFTNCFRYERPQRGRYREFWQFGVELIGSNSYLADLEVITLAYEILNELKIKFNLEIGHVGLMRSILADLDDTTSSKIMRLIDKRDIETLDHYLNQKKISDDIRNKIFQLIEMRGGLEILDEAKKLVDFDIGNLRNLGDSLYKLGIDFEFNLGIARGLDYYTGVVFECYAENLGSQNQICGGGSYELAHLFGGEKIPATGFAIGFDRVCELSKPKKPKSPVVAVISFRGFEILGFKISEELRKHGLITIVDVMERSIKKQLSYANDVKADYAIILGENEVKSGLVSIKNLSTGEQFMMELKDAITYITTSHAKKRE